MRKFTRLMNQAREQGQATFEFALTLVLVVTSMMFFTKLALLMAVGSYVQYGTFMAARALLSAGPNVQDQQERALRVITKTIKSENDPNRDKYSSVLKAVPDGEPQGVEIAGSQGIAPFEAGNPSLSWRYGVRYTYRGRLLNLFGGKVKDGPEMTSESWLGREPTTEECASELNALGAIYDNGC